MENEGEGATSSEPSPPSAVENGSAGENGSAAPSSLPEAAGRPQSFQPGDVEPPFTAGASSSAPGTSSSAPAAGASASSSTAAPGWDQGDVVVEEPVRPKENPQLSSDEVQALRADSFLLGADLKSSKQADKASAVDETFAQLEVALRNREYNVAEALWKRMVSVGAAAVIPKRPELQAIASRYFSAMCPRIQDELESAIERKDVFAAEREHQRLSDLQDTCKETRLDDTLDRMGRAAELEARYQQLCNKSGAVMCNLFPRVNGCMNQNGQDACAIL